MDNKQIEVTPQRDVISFTETRKVGKCDVTFVAFEHKLQRGTYPIESYIKDADTVGVEYFMPDIENTVLNKPLLGGIAQFYVEGGIRQLSDQISKIAAKEKKDIVVMDPANDISFAVGSKLLPGIGVGAGVYSILKSTLPQYKHQPTRRKFLKALGAGVLTLSTGMQTEVLQDIPPTKDMQAVYRDFAINGKDMRWQTIAQGIDQYCNTPENMDKKIVFFYPPAHIKDGILPYLDNTDNRRIKNALYTKVPGLRRQIREYTFQDQKGHTSPSWQLAQTTPIN